ncbi:MAG: ABC transporter permease [Methanobacteriota archaeon]|nr:MAG: ABC transporter permease [Euryarchaeota archaeon]
MALETALYLLGVVGLVCLAVVAWAGRKRFPLRIGVGNFFRRKTQVAIVVAGLLIGTSIITSSYVIQTTFDYTIRSAVFRALDHTDETITLVAADGRRAFFSEAVFDDLYANRSAMPTIDALAPRVHLSGAVVETTTRLFEPTATVIGFNASYEPGTFVRQDGSSWNGSDLGPGEVIVNGKLAENIEAKAGHDVVLAMSGPAGFVQMPATIRAVVQDAGLGAFGDGPNVFIPLSALQAGVGATGEINLISVSNVGGVTEGYVHSDSAVRELRSHLPSASAYRISNVKADNIDSATRNVDQLSQLFVLLGVFTIIAGILLIINIFVMLAEERKGEMGVARALGMRRKNLVQSFVSEGLLYALLSSLVGTFTGLLVAAVILWAFGQIFPPAAFGGVGFVLSWTWSDVIQGFSIGFLITMVTIGIASWRVSKLNIVRAIRDIPEPVQHRSTRRQVALGAGLSGVGVLLTAVALLRHSLILQDLGPITLSLGLAILTMRVVPARLVFSLAGAFIIGWVLSPWKFFSTAGADITLFIVAGLFLVLGGLLLVMFNSDTLLAVGTRIVRSRTWRPVVRTAIAYPMNKKFRTGATLASIALIMFTIATMSGIQTLVSGSITKSIERESGGYDLIGSARTPISNWSAALASYNTTSTNITKSAALPVVPVRISPTANFTGEFHNSSLVGIASGWTPPFLLQAIDPAYPDAAAAWAAVQANDGLAIVDGTVIPNNFGPNFGTFSAGVGDVFFYRNATGVARNLRVIGILYEVFVQGLWVRSAVVRNDFGVDATSLFYFSVRAGVDVTGAGHDLERYFIANQLVTVNIQALLNSILEVTMGIFNLLEAYLALGLVVGIAGLGVITMRNVVERRQETGALRAIGFRKSMVLRSFLLELSFIALTGITMGTILGIALSYDLYLRFFADQTLFVVPWARLVTLGAAAFAGSVLATASPAIRASRMPPAEALRRFE